MDGQVRARARAAEGELRKKLNMHERELDRRAEKLRKLEAQLKRMLTGDARAVGAGLIEDPPVELTRQP